MDHLLSDYAWSQGSRGPQMGDLGNPWVLAAHRGPVDQETLSDRVVQRGRTLLSGQGHHQTQEYLGVQANPPSLSHLAVLLDLVVPGVLLDQGDPLDQGALDLL